MREHAVEFLLAEDNEDDVVLIQESFGEARIANKLDVVRDGEEALAYLRQLGKYEGATPPVLVRPPDIFHPSTPHQTISQLPTLTCFGNLGYLPLRQRFAPLGAVAWAAA